jgi:hypothetical protein
MAKDAAIVKWPLWVDSGRPVAIRLRPPFMARFGLSGFVKSPEKKSCAEGG